MPETTAIAIRPDEQTRLDRMTYPAPALMTEADVGRATDDLAFVRSVRQGLETAKQRTLAPIRAQLDELRARYDQLLAGVGEHEARIKAVLLEWRRFRQVEAAQATRDAAAATAALAAAEARQDARTAGLTSTEAEAIADGVRAQVERQVAADIAPAPIPRATAGFAGTATVARIWKFEVVDPAAVPREYLAVDTVRIGKVVRAGVRAIPGVRIWEEETLVGRAR